MIKISDIDAGKVCRLGQGEGCCAYLVMGNGVFECVRKEADTVKNLHGITLSDQILAGTMTAKDKGDWKSCLWKDE